MLKIARGRQFFLWRRGQGVFTVPFLTSFFSFYYRVVHSSHFCAHFYLIFTAIRGAAHSKFEKQPSILQMTHWSNVERL